MAKNYNIRTASLHLDGGAAASDTKSIGAAVPAGMTRYVTFIRVSPEEPSNSEGSKIYLCSAATATAVTTTASASVTQKMVILFATASNAGKKDVMVPPTPDTEHPLFTIGSAAFLRAHCGIAATQSSSVQIFVQYFDE